MKIQFVSIILMLLALTACSGGGGQGSASFEVTRGFATSNTNFDGGLFIHGKKDSGEEFSFALAATHKASVVLAFGVWDIRVIGWDNNANTLEGQVLCANEKVNFQTANQTLALQVTNAKCNNNAFANADITDQNVSFISNSGGTISFKPLFVYTCGALYNLSDPVLLKTSFGASFCDAYPTYFRQKAKGLKFVFNNKKPDNKDLTPGIKSACVAAAASTGNPFLHSKVIPTRIPFTIELYEDDLCGATKLLGTYNFPNGYDNNLSRAERGFDYILNEPTDGEILLALASPLSQRGTGVFTTEAPFFHCNTSGPSDMGTPCLSLPPLPGGRDYFLQFGRNTIKIPNGPPCSASFISSSGFISRQSCEVKSDRATYLELEVHPDANPATETFTMDNMYTVQVRPFYNQILRNLMKSIGYTDAGNPMENSIADKNNDHHGSSKKNEGALDDVGEMLSPAIMGGFFWDQPCSPIPLPAPVIRTLSFYDEGELTTYSVTMKMPPAVNGPKYLVNSADPRSLISMNPFHRRFVFRELITPPADYKTDMIIDIACDSDELFSNVNNLRIGRLEEVSLKTESNNTTRDERKLMYWNTSLPADSRFEVYRYSKETDNSGVIKFVNTSYERGQKLPSGSTETQLRLTRLNYNFSFNANTPAAADDSYMENLIHSETDLSGTNIFHKESANLSFNAVGVVTPPGSIFIAGPNLSEINEERYGYNTNGNQPSVMKVLPNGNWIRTFQFSTQFNVESFDGSVYDVQAFTTTPTQVAMDVSPDGNFAIIVASSGTTMKIITRISPGGWTMNSISNIGSPQSISSLTKIKTAILDNGDFLIAARSNNFKLFHATGTLDGATDIPASLLVSTVYTAGTDQIQDIAVTKDSDEMYLFLHRFSNVPSSSYEHNIDFCSMVHGSSCILSGNYVYDSGPPGPLMVNVKDLSAFGSGTGDVVVSYTLMDTGGPPAVIESKARFSTNSGTSWSGNETFSSPQFKVNVNQPNANSYMMNDASSVGSPTTVLVPFVSPVVPSFRMNFKSLNPLTMPSQVFTDPAVFKDIQ